MSEFTERIEDLRTRVDAAKEYFDVAGKRERAGELEKRLAEPGVWDDPDSARRLTTELSRLNDVLHRHDRLVKQLDDIGAADELLSVEEDPDLAAELREKLDALQAELDKVELASLLSGEYDSHDAVASLHAGAGGVDSQDWTEMLLRMYLRWAEREGLQAELDEVLPGDEAGTKSATLTVKGTNAYGLLSAERGVHRLVRLSPFDQAHRRHTSFASLDVIPLMDEEEQDVEIDPKDLRIDIFRATGPGGQGVNTTDSAVRITHLPTGITAACQNERSQLQNRAVAMRILASRLAERARREREEKIESLRGERRDIEFGSQIRSYVLHPYRLVKDHRTGVEAGNVDAVLDGDLEPFIEAELRRRAGARASDHSGSGTDGAG
ncbi:MAG TPA: peptide chain release factor 2 [Actinomycetota bacterium]|nr:peptide chain release factor 2 [Actinomycetota bacterium]